MSDWLKKLVPDLEKRRAYCREHGHKEPYEDPSIVTLTGPNPLVQAGCHYCMQTWKKPVRMDEVRPYVEIKYGRMK